MVFGVSIWWVLLAAVVYMVVGALWYSPALFARAWTRETGKQQMQTAGGAMYLVPAVGALIVALMLAYLAQQLALSGWWSGAMLGLEMWLAFAATTALTNRVFQGSSMRLFAIDLGYHLVGFVLAGAIVVR